MHREAKTNFVTALLAAVALTPMAALAHEQRPTPPFKHLELDLTSQEYDALFGHLAANKDTDALAAILAVGKRNLDWLEFINAARTDEQKLALSTAETQRGYPIGQPTLANRELISGEWMALQGALPPFITNVLLSGGDFISALPISDDEFLTQIRLVDRIYQRAARWLGEEPYLEYYAEGAAQDVRGYYYLNATPDLQQTLTDWNTASEERKSELSGWLIGECRNTDGMTVEDCTTKLAAAVTTDGGAWTFHQTYVGAASALWDSFFTIPVARTDVIWTSAAPNSFTVPFRDPGRDDVKNWLKDNIQDEWRWPTTGTPADNWQLVLDFKPDGADDVITHINFEAGATPHVNDVAGNEITMDGNRNIAEYTSRWAIRHEYGHVLGFPDCYLEFYDKDAGVMVSYQLDITNLMCSRTGHFQQRHFDELKRVYYKE